MLVFCDVNCFLNMVFWGGVWYVIFCFVSILYLNLGLNKGVGWSCMFQLYVFLSFNVICRLFFVFWFMIIGEMFKWKILQFEKVWLSVLVFSEIGVFLI